MLLKRNLQWIAPDVLLDGLAHLGQKQYIKLVACH
jgi:hypothetical protein